MNRTALTWTRSSRCSADSPQCVEVAPIADAGLVAFRDSKDPHGPILGYTRDEWLAFRDSVKAGEFDHI